jgi:hypothetical protein
VLFPREFFDIQFAFAERVRTLTAIPLERALLEYTNFYVRFGCGRHFDPKHETWQAYLTGLRDSSDPLGWTYQFYLSDAETKTTPPLAITIGCFSYALQERDVVRLHFHNADLGLQSPLDPTCVDQRRAELAAIFAHVRGNVGGRAEVVGTSWLYNLEAYRRLFPRSYATSGKVVERFRSMPLWGQFVSHRSQLKAPLVRQFLDATAKLRTPANLADVFPLQPFAVRAPVQQFYDRYGV